MLQTHGLIRLGRCDTRPEDRVDARSIEIVGNAGSTMFEIFQCSLEFKDGGKDPLNRWTRRIVGAWADDRDVRVLFPFDGPPHFPFQRWALRASAKLHPSPLGLLIHERFGLWFALRAAILHAEPASPPEKESSRPCTSCAAQPCLTACPVQAFDGQVYDYPGCAGHVASEDLKNCGGLGCAARHACPIGRDFTYTPPHASFHMNTFRTHRFRSERS